MGRKILVSWVVLAIHCTVVNLIPPLKKIVGGSDVDISEVPYQVQIENNGHFLCGGSIYKFNYVISAAHCFEGLSEEDVTVRAGTTTLSVDGKVYQLQKLVIHENFDNQIFDNDVAVITIDGEFDRNEAMAPISLTSEEPEPGTTSTTSGWGALEPEGSPSYILQSVSIPIVSKEECSHIFSFPITERMLCAGIEGKDACQGDSGGPLVVNNQLVGITSFGEKCGIYPGVYANIAALKDWIEYQTP